MNLERYNKFLKEFDDIKSICLVRAEQKMEVKKIGYGKDNFLESIKFEKTRVRMIYTNIHHDYRETSGTSLTREQILMSDSEWKDYIQKIIEAKNEEKTLEAELFEIQEKENRRNEYKKLKEEFE